MPYGSGVSLTGGEEEIRRKKMTIFNFFKFRFLGFYKTELKSEDIIFCTQEGHGFPQISILLT